MLQYHQKIVKELYLSTKCDAVHKYDARILNMCYIYIYSASVSTSPLSIFITLENIVYRGGTKNLDKHFKGKLDVRM